MNDASIPRLPLGDNVLYPLTLATGEVLLVDAGPDIPASDDQPESWTLLGAQLAAHDIEPSRVVAVLVTHAHLDHAGLAHRWAEVGATILAGPADIPAIELGQESRERQRALQFLDLGRHGCPPEVIEGMRSPRGRHPANLRWEPTPSASLAAPDARYDLEGGRTLEVIAAPGHTPGNLVAFIPEDGLLFSGDTILPTTVPTAGMHYPLSADGEPQTERWRSLPPFIEAVSELRQLGIRCIYPGHGELVDDPDQLFDRFEEHHARRARRIRKALADGPLSGYGIAKRMFPRLPARRLGQAITEVLGHLDILEAAGQVEITDDGEQLVARLVD